MIKLQILLCDAGQFLFDHLLEHLEGLCPDDRLSVDYEGWCALYTDGSRTLGGASDQVGVLSGIQTLVKSFCVQV